MIFLSFMQERRKTNEATIISILQNDIIGLQTEESACRLEQKKLKGNIRQHDHLTPDLPKIIRVLYT